MEIKCFKNDSCLTVVGGSARSLAFDVNDAEGITPMRKKGKTQPTVGMVSDQGLR